MLNKTSFITVALTISLAAVTQPATARGGGSRSSGGSTNHSSSFTVTHGGNPPRASAPPAAAPTIRDHRRSNVEVRDHRKNRRTVAIRDHR